MKWFRWKMQSNSRMVYSNWMGTFEEEKENLTWVEYLISIDFTLFIYIILRTTLSMAERMRPLLIDKQNIWLSFEQMAAIAFPVITISQKWNRIFLRFVRYSVSTQHTCAWTLGYVLILCYSEEILIKQNNYNSFANFFCRII